MRRAWVHRLVDFLTKRKYTVEACILLDYLSSTLPLLPGLTHVVFVWREGQVGESDSGGGRWEGRWGGRAKAREGEEGDWVGGGGRSEARGLSGWEGAVWGE